MVVGAIGDRFQVLIDLRGQNLSDVYLDDLADDIPTP